MHRDLDLVDRRPAQGNAGDALGDGLDEVDRIALDRGDDRLGELAVVNGAPEVVARCGRREVDLIETVAERVAGVALGWAAVDEVEVTVHKPQAPISVPFTDVSVTIVRGRA